jgi:hypothetical protein
MRASRRRCGCPFAETLVLGRRLARREQGRHAQRLSRRLPPSAGHVTGKGAIKSPGACRLIWEKSSGLVVYDNQMDVPDGAEPTTTLASGSVIIRR